MLPAMDTPRRASAHADITARVDAKDAIETASRCFSPAHRRDRRRRDGKGENDDDDA